MHLQRSLLLLAFIGGITILPAQNDLPRGLSPAELVQQDFYPSIPGTLSGTPPPAPVRSMAEWEELQALVITWSANSNGRRDILTEIVRAAREECTVIICCNNQSTLNFARNYLLGKGVNLDSNVEFIISNYDSIWIRDYGPNCVYTNDVDSLYFIDWIYNRPRPFDDALPVAVANHLNVPLYRTLTAPNDLVHTGGNFMSDGMGTGFSSRLVLDENGPNNNYGASNHSEAEVDEIMFNFMGIDRYPKMVNLPYDDIHHIDMHMKLLDEETLLVGEYPARLADGPQIEANIRYVLNNYRSAFGTPYKLVRIPMPPQGNAFPNTGGDYRTYANAVFVNKTVIVPFYEERYDTTAQRIWEEALPGYKIVGVNCNNIIPSNGAIHCITKEIGVADPLRIVHQPLADVQQSSQSPEDYPVYALIQHRSGISGAKVWYSPDPATGWTSVEMSPYAPNDTADIWVGRIPRYKIGHTIHYYIEAVANTGKEITRPLPAPEGHWKFRIKADPDFSRTDVSLSSTEQNLLLHPAFPNPASAITCVPVHCNRSISARIALVNTLGQTVERLHDGLLPAGDSNFFFHAGMYPPGLYFIDIQSPEGHFSQKIIIR